MDPFCYLCFVSVLSVRCSLVVTCWETANLCSLLCDVFLCFVTFALDVLAQMLYLIVSISDLCLLPNYSTVSSQGHNQIK